VEAESLEVNIRLVDGYDHNAGIGYYNDRFHNVIGCRAYVLRQSLLAQPLFAHNKVVMIPQHNTMARTARKPLDRLSHALSCYMPYGTGFSHEIEFEYEFWDSSRDNCGITKFEIKSRHTIHCRMIVHRSTIFRLSKPNPAYICIRAVFDSVLRRCGFTHG